MDMATSVPCAIDAASVNPRVWVASAVSSTATENEEEECQKEKGQVVVTAVVQLWSGRRPPLGFLHRSWQVHFFLAMAALLETFDFPVFER